MDFFIVGGLVACLVLSVAVSYMIVTQKIKAPSGVLALVILIPFWGALSALIIDRTSKKLPAGKPASAPEDHLYTDSTPSLAPTQSLSCSDIIPLEEAMLVNDSSVRRKLVMEIVEEDPKKYLPTLRKVGFMGDREVMHYASTVIMEIREDLESEVFTTKQHYLRDPQSLTTSQHYAQALQNYIESGLLEGELLLSNRSEYAKVLDSLRSRKPHDLSVFIQWMDNEIERGRVTNLRDSLEEALLRWECDEQLLLLKIKLDAKTRYARGIKHTLSLIDDKQTKISPQTREVAQFWAC